MNGREDEFDGPLGGQSLRLQRIGEPETTDRQVRTGRATPVQLPIHVLTLGQDHIGGEAVRLAADQGAVQVGRAHFQHAHVQFLGHEAGQGRLQLRVGEEEDRLSGQLPAMPLQRPAGAVPGRRDHRLEPGHVHAEGLRRGTKPGRRAIGTEREQGCQALGAATFELLGRLAQKGLGQQEAGVRPDGGHLGRATRREEGHPGQAHGVEQALELVLDDIRQGSHDHEAGLGRGIHGHFVQQGRQAGILALREGGLDAAAGIVHDPQVRTIPAGQALGGPGQVELDDLRRTGPDEEQDADVGAAGEQLGHHAVQFLIGVGHAREIALFHDRGGEAGLREHHHPGCGLDQVGAGARTDHEEEGVLDLAMQPHDPGQATEDLALAALPQHRPASGRLDRGARREVQHGHAA